MLHLSICQEHTETVNPHTPTMKITPFPCPSLFSFSIQIQVKSLEEIFFPSVEGFVPLYLWFLSTKEEF